MKKSLGSFIILTAVLCGNIVFADFRQHFDLGQNYLSQYQYSAAITEFKSALRINYMDKSARIGLVNSYLARGVDYANKDKNYSKAADDFRSALFYLKYYPNQGDVQNSAQAISQVSSNLEKCLEALKFDFSSKNRFSTGKKLRAEGNFTASAYEFQQALGDKDLQKDSFSQIGDIMKLLGNLPKAQEYYSKAVAVGGNDLNLRLTYAKVLESNKEFDLANQQYSYVLEHTNSDNKEILYILERTFSKKLESEPNNANLAANMGAIMQKQEKYDEALNYYMKSESLDPSNINTRINIGTLYQQKQDYRTAIKMYESVLIVDPNNVNANFYRAQCYDKIGESKIAQDGYKKVLALDPNNSMIKAQMLDNVKLTSTPEQFAMYVGQNFEPNDASGIFYDYALELHKANKLEDSIFMYNQALKTSKGTNPEIFVNLALAQAQGQNYEGAISTLQSAKAKFPNNKTISDKLADINKMKLNSQMNLASDFYKNKDYQNAIQAYLAINPATVDSMLGAATSYQELGDKKTAIEYYKKALELKPVDSDIAYYIGALYSELEDYDNAKIYMTKAVTFNKNNKDAANYLAQIEEMDKSNLLNDAISLYDNNQFDESLAKFNQLLSKDSKNSYALYYRGMIFDSKGKKQEAINDLKKAYDLNKDFTICNYLIASDYDELGKYKEAYNYYLSYANSDVPEDEYKKYAKDRAQELKDYANKK